MDETARTLGTDTVMGLTAAAAASRLEKHGPNALRQAKKRTIWQMYLAQFKDVMVLVLLAAALISGVLLGEWVDAGIILLVVLLNALLGVIQENRAEKSLEALKKLSSPEGAPRRRNHLRARIGPGPRRRGAAGGGRLCVCRFAPYGIGRAARG